MADPLPIDVIVALPDATCKYILITTLHPLTTPAEAARLSGYKGKAGGNLKKRVAGVLGPYFEAEGITVEFVMSRMLAAMNATKTRDVILSEKVSTGVGKARQIVINTRAESVDLGPDHNTRLKACGMVMNYHIAAEKQAPPALPAPEEPGDVVPEMSVEELEAAAGRGPTEVIDAEYEVTEESDVASG